MSVVPLRLVYNVLANNTLVSIGLNASNGLSFVIDWGDGADTHTGTGSLYTYLHTFTTAGNYTVNVFFATGSGSITELNNQNSSGMEYLTECNDFGDIGLTSLQYAFYNATNLTIVPSSSLPTTSTITNLSSTFYGASAFNQDISLWDTSSVTDMSNMFAGASAFNKPFNTSGYKWNTSSVVNMDGMFYGALDFNNGDTGNNSNKALNWNTISVDSMSNMFGGALKFNQPLTTNGNIWKTSSVGNMSFMFSGASTFNQDISSWDTSSVTAMYAMFSYASLFNNGDTGNNGNKALNWNTSSVTNMSDMFRGASTFNQYIGNWNTFNVEYMNGMFAGASLFNNGDTGNNGNKALNLDTHKVKEMSYMFQDASKFNQPLNTNGNIWKTSLVENMPNMFNRASTFNQYIGNWDTSLVRDMSYMFAGASVFNNGDSGNNGNNSLNWITSLVGDMSYMFQNASAFNQYIGGEDSDYWKTTSLTQMYNMFDGASVFNNGDTGNTGTYILIWDTHQVTDMSNMFNGASKFNQPLTTYGNTWKTSSVGNMSSMFNGASTFNQDISSWDTSSVGDMNYMFHAASAFNQNISSWDTHSVQNMYNMFDTAVVFNNGDTGNNGNKPLTSWDTYSVGDMSYMFNGASNFNQDISSWDTSLVKDMSYMFSDASIFNQPLTRNENIWNTHQVERMNNMFQNAFLFNQNLNSWDTSSVTNMSYMFFNTPAFNQDISSWNLSMISTNGTPNSLENMLDNSGIDPSNYNKILIGWANQYTSASRLTLNTSELKLTTPANGITLGAIGLIYNSKEALAAHNKLTSSPIMWIINGDKYVPTPVPPVPPISNVCFPENTPIQTDQGTFAIQNIDPKKHTIQKKKIIAITQTITEEKYLICFEKNSISLNYPTQRTIMSKDHRLLFNGKLREAEYFIGKYERVYKVKYNREILYNVLMKEYDIIVVNNLICETLHPNHLIAKLYNSVYENEYKNKITIIMNDAIKKKNYNSYKKITSFL